MSTRVIWCLWMFLFLRIQNGSSSNEISINNASWHRKTISEPCDYNIDCGLYEICHYNTCICEIYAELNIKTQRCERCPYEGETCTFCCSSWNFECIDNVCQNCADESGTYVCRHHQEFFATASQIALSVAMLLGILILLSMLYRICTKPRYLASNIRPTNRQSNVLSRSSAIRISVSSIHTRVLARLQNRPPRYETQTDYEQRNIESGERACDVAVVVTTRGEAPPAYDGVREDGVLELPPPYSVAVISPTIEPSSYGNSNQAFVEESSEDTSAVSGQVSENRTNLFKCNIIVGSDKTVSDCAKSIHI